MCCGKCQIQTKIFYEGSLLFEGKSFPVEVTQDNHSVIKTGGAFNLAKSMKLGEYILQITVNDKLAKRKYQTVSEFIPFEIID